MARATEIIRYFHVLVNIASKWQTTFDPQIDSSKKVTEYGWLDYGGGIVKGQKGLLMRACTRDDVSPLYKDLRYNHAPTGMLYGPFDFEGHRWYCLNGTSRDSYAGTVFGLSVALDFLATERTRRFAAAWPTTSWRWPTTRTSTTGSSRARMAPLPTRSSGTTT